MLRFWQETPHIVAAVITVVELASLLQSPRAWSKRRNASRTERGPPGLSPASEAQVLQSEATVLEARATLHRYEQVSQLSHGKVPSRAEMDAGQANLKRAEAKSAGTAANRRT
jgi:hypothetical protein